jgi:hypothetical protein
MTKREAKIEALYLAEAMIEAHASDNLGMDEPEQSKVQKALEEISKELGKRIQRLLTS